MTRPRIGQKAGKVEMSIAIYVVYNIVLKKIKIFVFVKELFAEL